LRAAVYRCDGEHIRIPAGCRPDIIEGRNHYLASRDGTVEGFRYLFVSRHGYVSSNERLKILEDACGVVRFDEGVLEVTVTFQHKTHNRRIHSVLIRACEPAFGRHEGHFDT
jgi:hypothetical protein